MHEVDSVLCNVYDAVTEVKTSLGEKKEQTDICVKKNIGRRLLGIQFKIPDLFDHIQYPSHPAGRYL